MCYGADREKVGREELHNVKGFLGGRLGGPVGWASDFGSGHDLTACGFEPRVGLCADSSGPGACFGLCVSLSLSLSLSLSAPARLVTVCVCVSLSKINEPLKKKKSFLPLN